ncbi:hypothetical protein NE237_029415 [Protea cynaroides]|uniref:Uncharacterized protein n=1 Tax=Protea cynaroides TaxID=273540 RepID=A0A9Q0GTV2_9MAGN|nr:hypothetical protein NE237_029415 [Protea cynaroides]
MAPETTHDERDQTTDINPSTHLEKTLESLEFPEFVPELAFTVPGDQIPATETCEVRDGNGMRTVTRLWSGVISRISYFRCGKHGFAGELSEDNGRRDSCLLRRLKEKRERRERSQEVLYRVLRRRSLPCTSYSFFVINNWDSVNRSSFEETSKRLSEMWSILDFFEFIRFYFKP